MSAEFIPGQNARAVRETLSESGTKVVKNAQVTVEAYFGGTQFMARLEGDTGLIFYTADFEPVEPPAPYPATPAPSLLDQDGDDDGREAAPLDPTLVKAGDMVTLRIKHLDRPMLTLSGETHTPNTGHGVFLGGWRVDDLPDYVTLTDHQPAPEPEPEWNGAADYVATVRGVPGVRVTWSPVDDGDSNPWRTREPITDEKHSWHPESEVADVRPLVVIDPEAVDVVELAKAAWDRWDGQPADTSSNAHFRDVVRAVLAKVGLEAAR